jgi:predicted kinase
LIVVVCGLPGVGKTMLARNLAPLIDASLLSSDKIRKELIFEPKYTSNEKKLIYNVLILIAKYLHNAGLNCILDATFNTQGSRKDLIEKLDLTSQQICMVECICPEPIAISRLKNRKGDYSDANICIYRKMKRIYEPLEEEHIVVDTSQLSAKENAKQIAEMMLKGRR